MTIRTERQTWHDRVAELLDDPVGQAVLRRDGLTRDDVMKTLAMSIERRRYWIKPAIVSGG